MLMKQLYIAIRYFHIISYIPIPILVNVKECVGIQTVALLVTLWISYGHPARNKRAGYLFEFHLSITLAVILISRTISGPMN